MPQSPNSNSETDPQRVLERSTTILAGLQCEISHLRSHEQAIIRDINEQHHLLNKNSIHRLFDDILFYIFTFIIQDADADFFFDCPWDLAAVCQRWRKVCLDNPVLWSYLRMETDSGHDCRSKTSGDLEVYRTLLQIQRSAEAPLYIDASLTCFCTSQVSRLRALVTQSHRWREVSFMWFATQDAGSDAAALDQLRRLVQAGPYPQLRLLQWNVQEREIVLSMPFLNCDTLVNLESLEIQGEGSVHDLRIHSDGDFPWHQLKSLSLKYGGHPYDLLSILSNCQNLENLDLVRGHRYRGRGRVTDIALNSVILSRLREFSFRVPSDATKPSILPYIRLPRLHTASFYDVKTAEGVDMVACLITRSACSETLTKLYLDYSTPESVIALLQYCPSLELLYFEPEGDLGVDVEKGNLVAQSLALDEQFKGLCPRLKELRLYDLNIDPVVLISTVDSRLRGGGDTRMNRLQYLHWSIPKTLNPVDDERRPEFCKALFERKYSSSDLYFSISAAR